MPAMSRAQNSISPSMVVGTQVLEPPAYLKCSLGVNQKNQDGDRGKTCWFWLGKAKWRECIPGEELKGNFQWKFYRKWGNIVEKHGQYNSTAVNRYIMLENGESCKTRLQYPLATAGSGTGSGAGRGTVGTLLEGCYSYWWAWEPGDRLGWIRWQHPPSYMLLGLSMDQAMLTHSINWCMWKLDETWDRPCWIVVIASTWKLGMCPWLLLGVTHWCAWGLRL